MKIYNVTDPEFIPYGRVIEGAEVSQILKVLKVIAAINLNHRLIDIQNLVVRRTVDKETARHMISDFTDHGKSVFVQCKNVFAHGSGILSAKQLDCLGLLSFQIS